MSEATTTVPAGSWLDDDSLTGRAPGLRITCGNPITPGCGRSYDDAEFDALPRQRRGNGLRYADCACGSTLCRELA